MILSGEIKSPPFSASARIEAGHYIWLLQKGDFLSLPHSRPMPVIGQRCHELRIHDEDRTWRIIYRLDPHAVIVVDVFAKKTQRTPDDVIQNCVRRLSLYDEQRRRLTDG